MTDADERELFRLANVLQSLDQELASDPSSREALRKAGIALGFLFLRGLRSEIEQAYSGSRTGLSEEQRQHLR